MSETTLDDVRHATDRWVHHAKDERAWRRERDNCLEVARRQGYTLGQLAQASGLSKQRVYQITEGA